MTYVQVPVPEEHVPAVFDLLARLQAGEAKPQAKAAEKEPPPEATPELVARIYEESGEPHRAMLHFLADNPDRWVESHKLVDALDLPSGSKSMAGLSGAFGRRANYRYGGFKPWDYDWDRKRGEGRYRMRADVAEWVRRAAEESG